MGRGEDWRLCWGKGLEIGEGGGLGIGKGGRIEFREWGLASSVTLIRVGGYNGC